MLRACGARRLAGGALVAACALATAFGLRKIVKPFEPPAPAFRQKGPANARVVIVEFSDFQCPHCAAAEKPLKDILAIYGGDVRLVFKHFPIDWVHPRARAAAGAAECAGRRGKFWELHDELFATQAAWSVDPSRDWVEKNPDWMLPYARQAGVDIAGLKECMGRPDVGEAIAKDVQDARDLWVNGAPTFFVNGKRFAGGGQLAALAPSWIKKQLKQKTPRQKG